MTRRLLPRVGEVFGVDLQFGVQVGGQGVVLGQLGGDLGGGLRRESFGLIDRGQLGQLIGGHLAQLAAFLPSEAVSLGGFQ